MTTKTHQIDELSPNTLASPAWPMLAHIVNRGTALPPLKDRVSKRSRGRRKALEKLRVKAVVGRAAINHLKGLASEEVAMVEGNYLADWAHKFHNAQAKKYEEQILADVKQNPHANLVQAVREHPLYDQYKHHINHAIKFANMPSDMGEEENEDTDHYENALDEAADEYINAAVITVCENLWGNEEHEYEEDIDESVYVSHNAYLRSHGKHPRGTGNWMIGIGTDEPNYHDNEGKDYILHNGPLKDAVKKAKLAAKSRGAHVVHVLP